MAKIIARNASLYLEDANGASQAFGSLFNSITLGQSAESPESTGFGEATRQRLPDGLKDWELSFDGYLDTGASKTDEVLSGILSGSTVIKFGPAGSAASAVKYTACGILQDYEMQLGVADAATVTGTVVARSGSMTRSTW